MTYDLCLHCGRYAMFCFLSPREALCWDCHEASVSLVRAATMPAGRFKDAAPGPAQPTKDSAADGTELPHPPK